MKYLLKFGAGQSESFSGTEKGMLDRMFLLAHTNRGTCVSVHDEKTELMMASCIIYHPKPQSFTGRVK